MLTRLTLLAALAAVTPAARAAPEPAVTSAACVTLHTPGMKCSATVVGERRPDGRSLVLGVAHCARSIGATGTVTLSDGRTLAVVCVAIDTRADVAWWVTEATPAALPSAKLATAPASPGTPVWHEGRGVDKPGNHETGHTTRLSSGPGRLWCALSVSQGDSGAAIFAEGTGEVVGLVAATTAFGRLGSVWVPSAAQCAATLAAQCPNGTCPVPTGPGVTRVAPTPGAGVIPSRTTGPIRRLIAAVRSRRH